MQIALPLQPTADDIAHLENDHNRRYAPHLLDPQNAIRQRIVIERAIIRRAVSDILAAGNWVRVYYGDNDYGCPKTDNLDVAMSAIGACDDERLQVFRNSSDKEWSSAWFVYGNDGWDVIADNGERLEPLLAGASALADQIAEEDARRFAEDLDPVPDSPHIEDGVDNCNDAGTGEGRYHGRM